MLKIIGGLKKNTILKVPKDGVRPTSSKKRESIFSIILSYSNKLGIDAITDQYILDLFAGSGSLGLEAISRGAKFCYFYEKEKEVIKILKKNCLKICRSEQYNVIQQDIKNSLYSEIEHHPSIIFIDPPYKLKNFEDILNNLLKSKKIIIESDKNTMMNVPTFIYIFDERFFGKTKITFLSLI